MASTAEIIYKLNCYYVNSGHVIDTAFGEKTVHDAGCGCDIWQDLIMDLDEYDEGATDAIDTGQNDRFALTDGTVLRFDSQGDRWYEQ